MVKTKSRLNLNSSENKLIISIILFSLLFSLLIMSISNNINLQTHKLCGTNEKCLYNLILDTSNTSLCDFSQDKSICYKKTSIDFKNSSLCEYTNNISMCKIDLAITFKNVSICNSILNISNINNCIFQISTYTFDSTLCEKSSNPSRCYYSYALFSNNISICSKSDKYENLCTNKIKNIPN